jgi:uncharacterized protein YciI
MVIVLVNYRRPLPEIDAALPDHREFLKRFYAEGKLLLSGRREPRTGGVIFMDVATVAEARAIAQEDPFHARGLAEYDFIELHPTMAGPALQHLVRS